MRKMDTKTDWPVFFMSLTIFIGKTFYISCMVKTYAMFLDTDNN